MLALAGAAALTACAPALIGGAIVGTAAVAADRRSPGAQVEDQSIELKADARIRELTADRAHVNVTSYNRMVLLTGESPEAADRVAIERAISRVEGVRSIVNEIAVMGKTTLTARSNDGILTARVKASLIDAKDVQANAIKVTTERGTVYLMGRVTEREAARAAEVARKVDGVSKVVRVFEILTDAELAELSTARPALGGAPAEKK